ncbi:MULTISPECIES: hypothetical protein [Halorussus]|uniref:hypothetical protein n=1 Tax=Halorussus TaxID=1070314 RepID=UPI00209F305F|nr:hypothetical protein [Halorussus vallis]USZ76681.1 hypothetical protein NGM07_04970 [Halorussus vallis]
MLFGNRENSVTMTASKSRAAQRRRKYLYIRNHVCERSKVSHDFQKAALAALTIGIVASVGCLTVLGSSTAHDERAAHLTATEVPAERVQNVSAERRATFESLPEKKRTEFRAAVNGKSVEPVAWNRGRDIELVEYDGRWYEVEVHLV